jgi:probable F420-dependent oxidoreductase
MRVGVSAPAELRTIAAAARHAEALGYDALSVGETRHHPFLPLALAAEHSSRITLSTAVAIAFPRAPHVTANLAWDLARYSDGRFALGLGTQVKGHNERRFSVPWAPPGPRIADYIGCLRAIWDSWQHGTRPAYEGEFYQYRLTAPAFNPGPIEHPRIPILISAVTPFTARLAGRIGDGAIVPAAVSFRYAREVLLPALLAGAREAGPAREARAAPELRGAGYLATGPDEHAVAEQRERARAEVARALATRAAAGVVDLHGWQERAERLRRLAGEGRWAELPAEVDDAMLDELCVAGTWEELPALARERCAGAVTQLELPLPDRELDPDERERFTTLIAALRDVPAAGAC